jgi:transcriptional regulator with XRE-family HTH domain
MPRSAVPSTFAERFEYARDRQRVLGTWAKDEVLGEAVGLSAQQISDYKKRDLAPPAERTLAIAKWCGVDPGWLGFGEDTKAPAPEGFAQWLETRRAPRLTMKPAKQPAAAAKKRA